jgi:hypothetical protein
MSSLVNRSLVGFALLAVLAAGCSSASASHPAAKQHHATSPTGQPSTPAPKPKPTRTTTSAPPAPPSSTSSIPQGNGGDHDPDNNGGPDDGDGNL